MISKFSEQDSGRNVEVSLGYDLELSLKENPTAGFRWNVVRNGSPVCAVVEENFTPGLDAAGQPGTRVWKFNVIAVGEATIEMTYGRSWESTSSTNSTFVLHLTGTK